jgi:membrane protease YdiL (CAAX protease family)
VDELTQNSQPELPGQPNSRRGAHWVFIGDNGLRAGWSALLFLILLAALVTCTIFVAHFFVHSHPNLKAPLGPRLGLLQEVLQFVLIIIATAIMALIEKRRIGVYGYSGSAKLARFCWGVVWGFIAISALIGSLWKFHLLAFDGPPLHGARAWEYAAAWAVVFLFVGLAEESLLRGYLQYTLTRGIGFWWAALLLSVAFGALHGHNPGESPIGLFSAGAVGLVFCLSLWYTGSLWWAIGFHAAWDWGQSYFYGTSDSGMLAKGHLLSEHPSGPLLWSGGATGPEGSLLIIPLLAIMALAMWLWWGRKTRSKTV